MGNRDSQGRRGDDPRDAKFCRAFEDHYGAIKSYYAKRTHDLALSDELAASTFEFAWRRIDQLPDEPGTRAWLYYASRRMLSNHWRGAHRYRNLTLKLATTQTSAPDNGTSAIDDERALAALGALRPREQAALQLIYWEGLSHAEAAGVLGCTTNAFDILVHRARRRMLTLIQDTSVAPQLKNDES